MEPTDDSDILESTDDSDILELYGSDKNPLVFMIEPKGVVRYARKDEETTKEDLENFL